MSDAFTATERLWDPVTDSLVHIPGDEVPETDRDRLVTETEWAKRRAVYDPTVPGSYRIESHPDMELPKRKAPRKTPAKKTVAKKVAAKKTTARRRTK